MSSQEVFYQFLASTSSYEVVPVKVKLQGLGF